MKRRSFPHSTGLLAVTNQLIAQNAAETPQPAYNSPIFKIGTTLCLNP